MYEYISDLVNFKNYLVMEYCPHGDLNHYIINKNLPLITKVGFMIDLGNGLQFLDNSKIMHRDLKPQNVLMADYIGTIICKITDFGLSRIERSRDVFSTMCGTPGFCAPFWEAGNASQVLGERRRTASKQRQNKPITEKC